LSGSGSGGGLSSNASVSQHPALALSSSSAPMVLWLNDTANGTGIYTRESLSTIVPVISDVTPDTGTSTAKPSDATWAASQ